MQLTFVSVNIWDGGRLMDELIPFLQNTNADIIAMQEVYNSTDKNLEDRFRSVEVSRERLAYPYMHFAPAFTEVLDLGRVVQGNCIFSKFPISTSETIFYDFPFADRVWDVDSEEERIRRNVETPRNLQEVTIDIGEGIQLFVFNTQGVWHTGQDVQERQIQMSHTIASHIAGKDRVIACGDFNVLIDTTNAGTIIESGGVRSIFKGELTTSFNMKRKPPTGTTYGTAVVDGLFVSPSIRVVAHSAPNVDVSDHLPLIATLEL